MIVHACVVVHNGPGSPPVSSRGKWSVVFGATTSILCPGETIIGIICTVFGLLADQFLLVSIPNGMIAIGEMTSSCEFPQPPGGFPWGFPHVLLAEVTSMTSLRTEDGPWDIQQFRKASSHRYVMSIHKLQFKDFPCISALNSSWMIFNDLLLIN